MRLLSDRIQEFIDWLEAETDFGVWDDEVRHEVHKKLIVCMISDEVKNENSTKTEEWNEENPQGRLNTPQEPSED